MIVAIHQPDFFPWCGFFAKILHSDLFILHDDIQFEKQGTTNRVKMNGPTGPWWMTAPIRNSNLRHLISQVELTDTGASRKTLTARVAHDYRKAPYFATYFPLFEECMRFPSQSLLEFNCHAIKQTLSALEIERPIRIASEYRLSSAKTQRVVDLVKAVGGTTYLSGMGAKAYHDEPLFTQAHINLVYQSYDGPAYPQTYGDYVGGLSIWDAIFNIGPLATRKLLDNVTQTPVFPISNAAPLTETASP